ncbi:YraN family protein [Chromatiaceae bacterium AAb-1]|nr:YraN family protein [Chromatiaceae bacterium AAb-1]
MNNKGQYYEQLALTYLQQQGLQLIQRNYRCKAGEIDLIMQDAGQLIFVEVKYRSGDAYGGAAAAVTWQKQQKLLRAIHWYLQQQKITDKACRIDVLAIEGQAPYRYNWLQNAIT